MELITSTHKRQFKQKQYLNKNNKNKNNNKEVITIFKNFIIDENGSQIIEWIGVISATVILIGVASRFSTAIKGKLKGLARSM